MNEDELGLVASFTPPHGGRRLAIRKYNKRARSRGVPKSAKRWNNANVVIEESARHMCTHRPIRGTKLNVRASLALPCIGMSDVMHGD